VEKAIEIKGLGKEFRIYNNPYARFFPFLVRGQKFQPVWALKDVNIDVAKGSTFGIVGENGAGKSTLLKILAGTTAPTEGFYRLRGSVSCLLELGAGFHHLFSGRENIYMNAAMMGFSRREMDKKYEEIVEFSGLREFIDAPIRTYSSGMVCRLGFSTAIAVDPEVLIVDEILAVGDMEFQKKCVDKIWQFKRSGKTMLFCSHSLYDVRQLCDSAVWIKDGRVRQLGDAVTVTNDYATYEKTLIGREEEVLQGLPGEEARGRANVPLVEKAWIEDPRTGERNYKVNPGDPVEVVVEFKNQDPPVDLCVGIGFTRSDSTLCFAHTTQLDGIELRAARGLARLKIPRLNLLAGEFVVFVYLMDGEGVHRYHQYLCDRNLVVENRTKDVGLFLQEHTWEIEA